MHRRKKRRPNWPYRLTWLGILVAVLAYVGAQSLVAARLVGSNGGGPDWGLAIMAGCLDATVAVWFVTVGASIGSFLNVVAYRMPLGRFVGGHSGCPFCQTPIDGTDNVPVLAWVKLRGRCRTCRLPISVQYPLVELTVALIFLAIYKFEFSANGGNLPFGRPILLGGNLMRIRLTPELVIRTLGVLSALSGLFAAAIIAVKNQAIPLRLFGWSILLWVIGAIAYPPAIVRSWRSLPELGPLGIRLDAFATLVCGAVAGIAIARVLAPILYRGFDRSLVSNDALTRAARQNLVAMAIVGALLGWQAIVPFTWILLISALLGSWLFGRYRSLFALGDITVWIWLGLLVFRCFWQGWESLSLVPATLPDVVGYVLGALLLAPLAWFFRVTNEQRNGEESDHSSEPEDPADGDTDNDAESDEEPDSHAE